MTHNSGVAGGASVDVGLPFTVKLVAINVLLVCTRSCRPKGQRTFCFCNPAGVVLRRASIVRRAISPVESLDVSESKNVYGRDGPGHDHL
jgi:hypothetical protein